MDSQAQAARTVSTAGWPRPSFRPVHWIALALGLVVGCGGSTTTTPPTVTGFTPTSGSYLSSTLVTVSGSGFGSGINSVTLGKVPVLSGSVLSDSALQFTVPATAVTGTISVATPGGTAASAAEFIVVPSVSTAGPQSGSISSATPVTITGYGLAGIYLVQFGTVTAIPTTQTANEIIVNVPPGAPQGLTSINLVPQPTYSLPDIIVPFTVNP